MRKHFSKICILILFSIFVNYSSQAATVKFHDEQSSISLTEGSQVKVSDNESIIGFEDLSIVQKSGVSGDTLGFSSGTLNYDNVKPTKIERMHIRDGQQEYTGDSTENEMTWLKEGFRLAPDASIYIQIPFPLACPFDLHGGLLKLGIDWHLSTSTTICPNGGGGRIQGNGYALIMDGNLVIPPGEYLRFTNDIIIDGLGHELILSTSAQLIVDMNTTLSLRNVIVKSLSDAPMQPSIVMSDTSSNLSMQNTKILLNGDYTFTQGYMFIHDDVVLSGTSQFIFESNQNLWINDHSMFIIDLGCTFSYAPRNGTRINLKMKDQTSFLYLNGCTLSAPGNGANNGIELTKGTLVLDNNINLQNNDVSGVNTNKARAMTFGNNTPSDDLNINLLASAQLDVDGYIDYQNVN